MFTTLKATLGAALLTGTLAAGAVSAGAIQGGRSTLNRTDSADCTYFWPMTHGQQSPTTRIYADYDRQSIQMYRAFYWWNGSSWSPWLDSNGNQVARTQAGTAYRNGNVIFQGLATTLNHPSDQNLQKGWAWTEVDQVRSWTGQAWSKWTPIGANGYCDFR